jgi:hypothetical protein
MKREGEVGGVASGYRVSDDGRGNPVVLASPADACETLADACETL